MSAPDLWLDFRFPPPVGLRIRYRKRFVTLTGMRPYVRVSGEPSWILEWQDDEGRQGTSGLRGVAITFTKIGGTP
jgi:hypothetical protein